MSTNLTIYRKFFFLALLFLLSLLITSAEAQFLRNFLQGGSQSSDWNLRDDRPEEEPEEELSLEEIICRDRETFPKIIYEKKFSSYFACKRDLDRIQEASYIDFTYRIRWDNDRLDLYTSGIREIYICDGEKLTRYEHDKKKDPDWWMIIRNSPEAFSCSSNQIFMETLD